MATLDLDRDQIIQGSDISGTNQQIQNADFQELELDRELISFQDTDEIGYSGDKSFWDRTIASVYKRTDMIQKSREMFADKEITLPEHVGHVYGKGGAGFLLDTGYNIIAETIDETWDGIENTASVLEGGIRMIYPEGANAIDENEKRIADMLTKWWNNSTTAEAGRKAIDGGAKMYATWKENNPIGSISVQSF